MYAISYVYLPEFGRLSSSLRVRRVCQDQVISFNKRFLISLQTLGCVLQVLHAASLRPGGGRRYGSGAGIGVPDAAHPPGGLLRELLFDIDPAWSRSVKRFCRARHLIFTTYAVLLLRSCTCVLM